MLEVYTESTKTISDKRKIKDIRELNIFKDTYREKTLYIKGKYSIPYTPNTIVDLSGFIVEEELDFSDCICEGEIDFSGTKFKKLNLKNAVFKAKITFHNCEFENVSFENTRFENLVDFYISTFHNDVQFLQVDFMDRAIFSNVSFKGETQFKYNKVAKDTFISFESAKFEKSLDISRSNFHCNLRFWNITIEGDENLSQYEKYINDFGKKKIEPSVYAKIRETYRIIKNAFYKENNRIEGLEFYKKEMDVYREKLKNKTKKVREYNNSKISYSEIIPIIMMIPFLYLYLRNEQVKWFYWIFGICFLFFIISSIKRQKITEKNVVKTFKENKLIYGTFSLILFGAILSFLIMVYYFSNEREWMAWIIFFIIFSLFVAFFSYLNNDKIILYLNKYSNNFGTNWVNGIVFILWVGMISYFLILISLSTQLEWDIDNPDAWDNFLKHFLEVINVTHWKDIEPFGVKLNSLAYFFLFIGRIFIGYGYYQTIQAFRKYGKSS
ncbi:MAG: pentapeptide repeat-containing protein [Capnocytophaga felis]|nr:pentapeptide repeat-containing protein [Capnocytophaga felis]